jgi:hypothetical protein
MSTKLTATLIIGDFEDTIPTNNLCESWVCSLYITPSLPVIFGVIGDITSDIVDAALDLSGEVIGYLVIHDGAV